MEGIFVDIEYTMSGFVYDSLYIQPAQDWTSVGTDTTVGGECALIVDGTVYRGGATISGVPFVTSYDISNQITTTLSGGDLDASFQRNSLYTWVRHYELFQLYYVLYYIHTDVHESFWRSI